MTSHNDSRVAYTLRPAADLGVRMVAVMHRKGNFRQHVDEHGNQSEETAHVAMSN